MESLEDALNLSPDANNEITGRLYLQFTILMPDGNYKERGEFFARIVFDVMHKLQAMLYHKNNYKHIEKLHLSEVIKRHEKEPYVIPSAKELSFEFEAFLFQAKSALDMTVKILQILFPGYFRVHTFESKGERLIKNLEHFKTVTQERDKGVTDEKRLKKVRHARAETIDEMIAMLREDKLLWLERLITMRNTISHYSAIKGLVYKVKVAEKEKVTLSVPKVLDVYPHEFMEITFRNTIEFIQDFLCLCIELWLPPIFRLAKADDSHPTIREYKESGVPAAKYIKYALGFREL